MSQDWGVLQPIMRWAEDRSYERTGIRPNYAASYWTPPLTPKLAFDLEQKQIENLLQTAGFGPRSATMTTSRAPLLLRSLPSARHIPVSLGVDGSFWTRRAFHLGCAQPAERGRWSRGRSGCRVYSAEGWRSAIPSCSPGFWRSWMRFRACC